MALKGIRHGYCGICGKSVPITELVYKRFVYGGQRLLNLLPSSIPDSQWTISTGFSGDLSSGAFPDTRRPTVGNNNAVSIVDGIQCINPGNPSIALLSGFSLNPGSQYFFSVFISPHEASGEQKIGAATVEIEDSGGNVVLFTEPEFLGRKQISFYFTSVAGGATTLRIKVWTTAKWYFEMVSLIPLSEYKWHGDIIVENSAPINEPAGKKYAIVTACSRCRDVDPEFIGAAGDVFITDYETYDMIEWEED